MFQYAFRTCQVRFDKQAQLYRLQNFYQGELVELEQDYYLYKSYDKT